MSSLQSIKQCFGGRFEGMTVLVTGHTGFKGSWLCLWLKLLGARVVGLSLSPATTPNHWDLLGLDVESHIVDIRDLTRLESIMLKVQPDLVMHLAAQALVRQSYAEPVETFSTNVLGTVNVLEAARKVERLRAILCVTSDKVYENMESESGYAESNRLGGADPYSCSKACTELVVDSYRKSWFNGESDKLIATARAGNVIGGGDWSQDRLIPDAAKAAANGEPLQLRNPDAVRPWQHVLEPIAGYLLYSELLLERDRGVPNTLNFGPSENGNVCVRDIIDKMQSIWAECRWEQDSSDSNPHETKILKLDSRLSQKVLDWQPVWSWQESVDRTAVWYQDWYRNQTSNSRKDLLQFVQDANSAGERWAA